MAHGPATEWEEEKSAGYKSKLGLIMFAIYVVIYLAFMLIAVLAPKALALNVGSLNLAIVYGFGLIVIAIVQAVVYNVMCSNREKLEGESHHKGEQLK